MPNKKSVAKPATGKNKKQVIVSVPKFPPLKHLSKPNFKKMNERLKEYKDYEKVRFAELMADYLKNNKIVWKAQSKRGKN